MGGLFFMICNSQYKNSYKTFVNCFTKLKHRGEDSSDYYISSNTQLDKNAALYLNKTQLDTYKPYTFMQGFHRTAVNDLSREAAQPFIDPIKNRILEFADLKKRPIRTLMCNGEIYNYTELKYSENFTEKDLRSSSDVEIIMPMYIKYGLEETLKRLNGDYSFILTENIETYRLDKVNVYVVRDNLGSKPLYMVKAKNNSVIFFVSELKCLPEAVFDSSNYIIQEVPPGTYWSFNNSIVNKSNTDFIRYYSWDDYLSEKRFVYKNSNPETLSLIYSRIREILTDSIYARYKLCDLPVGILLSGGFDSSILLSVLVKQLVLINHDFIKNPIYAFTIGELNNKDVLLAEQCVNYLENKYGIDIVFHIVNVQDPDIITTNLKQAIISLETYDATTIQKGIVLNTLFKYIKENTKVKVLLSGEGLNEICGGYKEINDSNDFDFQQITIKLIQNFSKYQLLRADKIAAKYNIELRHPFLDNNFLNLILSINPSIRKPQTYDLNRPKIEKYIVRKAFDLTDDEYLPYDILWRTHQSIIKSANNINEIINDYCKQLYTDSQFYNYVNNNTNLNNVNNKRDLYYKNVFNKYFPGCLSLIPDYWENLLK